MGNPVLEDIWVDPVNGNDINQGNNASNPIKTFSEAWDRIPQSHRLTNTGYRIMLMPGNYYMNNLPANGWMESRYGSYNYPIIIQSAYNNQRVTLKTSDIINFYNCQYIYLIDLNLTSQANNVLHLEKCDHILMKNLKITGLGNNNDYTSPQEDLKVNQCKYIYLEGCDISNAWNVPVDFVAVEYGHILGNRIHQAGDWCIYLKGGSSHFIISGNEIYDADNGGFTAGQGTGFEWMEPPYIHYEAYDIKFINNIIHDTHGAGMGVNGGYNILLAYNTLYRVGDRSHALEFVHGIRSGGNITKCSYYLSLGGWGTAVPGEEQRIPNKNVYVYNNIVYNPDGYQSQWSHFAIAEPFIPKTGSNIPNPSLADDNLQIKGNIIWNGSTNLPLGIEDINSTLTTAQLRSQNIINTIKPQLTDPENGNYRPLPGGNIYNYAAYPIPNFPSNDYPTKPLINPGNLSNNIKTDYEFNNRSGTGIPGAYASQSIVNDPLTVKSTSPLNNTTGIPTNSSVSINFSKNIQPGNNYSGIYIINQTSGLKVLISMKILGSTLTLNHTSSFKNNTTYKVFIPSGAVEDLKGNIIYSSYTFIFSTVAVVKDTTPPTITSTNPLSNATGVSLTSPITITFSENVYQGTNFSGIYIKNLTTGKIVGLASKTIIGKILTIKMTSSRIKRNIYQVYIPAGAIKDATGNIMAVPFSFQFRTA
jgi:methionine-rich copper-binding protein CopC